MVYNSYFIFRSGYEYISDVTLRTYFYEFWLFLKHIFMYYVSKSIHISMQKRYRSPGRGSNPQPSDDQFDALTIELL